MQKLIVLASLASLSGCAFMARGADMYRDDTSALLDTRKDEIQQCYDDILKTDPSAKGTVAIHFGVKKKTGEVHGAEVIADRTTAPVNVQQCVLTALEGLKLDPPDDRTDGDATFVWEFKAAPAKG